MRRLVLIASLLCLLGGCVPDAPGGEDGADDDAAQPYEPGAVEGIEEASEALTDLSGQCTYTAASGQMDLVLNDGDLALVTRNASGTILVNGFSCHGAIATQLTQLAVSEGTTGVQTLILDYTGGPFGLGRANQPGVTVALGADVSADAFKVIGARVVDTMVLGSAGVTVNADAFVDLTVTGADQLVFNLGDGNDSFSGAGSAAAGDRFPARVEIYGGAGNDTIQGGAGDDLYFGGEGDDTFRAGSGDDGSDVVNGGAGTDIADYTGRGANLSLSIDGVANDGEGGALEGDDLRADVETVKGGSGDDSLIGGAGSQTLQGGPGNDVLRGGAGNDTLSGDAGDDRFDEEASPSGADVMNGGAGLDTADYAGRSTAVIVVVDAIADDGAGSEADKVGTDVENVTGGSGNDRLTGSVGANLLVGGGGDDTLLGADGADVLRGGAGDDTLDGGPGNDRLDAEAIASGGDTLRGGAGIDLVDYSARTAAVDVTMDGVTPSGESGEGDMVATDVENLRGGPEGDALRGNALDNQLEGGDGDDNMSGLAGDDVIDGDAGSDVIDCGPGEADILLDQTTTTADNCEL